ncbi:hypothetical protein IAQ61_003181 [Plenodomus lingam]|uniref:uncharacterized protein n=1 Tax=Leptosphaeria maculans TaxID=5022 RepID=UPI00332AC8EC|nr:hypothetical protein IAQ61_003181 [Plenodomus lingam]
MAEVLVFLAAVQATTQLVEQAFRILDRIRSAHKRQKALVSVLERHESELRSIKTLIGIIEDEEELQTPSVGSEMVRLRDVQSKLAELLNKLDPKPKGKVNQFAHQLTQGSSDEEKLSVVMSELSDVKATLLLRIQISNVGIVKTMEKKQLVANAEVIERIDLFLREKVGNCEGLRIAKLLQGRRPSNDGTIPLTRADLKSLTEEDGDEDSGDETLVDDSEFPSKELPIKTERIILRNSARHQALQINAAAGEDIWKDISRLVIQDNVAEDQALQVNYGTTFKVTKYLLAEQNKRIAGSNRTMERKRHDSVHEL